MALYGYMFIAVVIFVTLILLNLIWAEHRKRNQDWDTDDLKRQFKDKNKHK